MHAVRGANNLVPASASASGASSSAQAAASASSRLAPIERLAADAIINYVLPFLFAKRPGDRYEGYFSDDATRAIFVASRNFSRLESHVLKMRGDYLGDILHRSCFFEDVYVEQPAPAAPPGSDKDEKQPAVRMKRQKAREIHPYFESMFYKKVVTVSQELLQVDQQKKRKKSAAPTENLIESRLLFSSIEILDCKSISIEKMKRVVRLFPAIKDVLLEDCKITPGVIATLKDLPLLGCLRLTNCKSAQSRKEVPYESAFNALQQLTTLHVDGVEHILSGGEALSLPKIRQVIFKSDRRLLHLQLLEGRESLTELIIGVMYSIPRERAKLLEGVYPALRRLSIEISYQSEIDFIARHPLLEELHVRNHDNSLQGAPLVQAILNCRQLKKLSLELFEVSYHDLRPLFDAGMPIEHLFVSRSSYFYPPTYENWKNDMEAMATARTVKALTLAESYLTRRVQPLEQEQLALIAASYGYLEELRIVDGFLTPTIVSMLPYLPHLKRLQCANTVGNTIGLDVFVLLEFMLLEGVEITSASKTHIVVDYPEDQYEYMEQVVAAFSNTVLDLDIMEDSVRAHVNDLVLRAALRARPELEYLNLRDAHNITDYGIEEMPTLEKLRILDLSRTRVTHRGFGRLSEKCPALEYLTVSKAPGLDYRALGMTLQGQKLKGLKLVGDPISYAELGALFHGPLSIETLDLSQVPIAMPLHKTIVDLVALICNSMRALKKITLRAHGLPDQRMTTAAVERLRRELPGLQVLEMHGGGFTLDISRVLLSFPGLQAAHFCGYSTDLAIGHMELTGFGRRMQVTYGHLIQGVSIEPKMVETLRQDTDLNFTIITQDFLRELTEADLASSITERPHLRSICAAGVPLVRDAVLEAMHELEALESVDLSGTRITAAGVVQLFENCPQLQHITLSMMPDFEKVIAGLQHLTDLRSFHVIGTPTSASLSVSCVQSLVAMQPDLTTLGLSHLKLDQKGAIAALGCLSRLQTLFLNDSTLSEDTFYEVVDLTKTPLKDSLKALDITGTKFPMTFDIDAAMSVALPAYEELREAPKQLSATLKNLKKVFKAHMPRCTILELTR